MNLMKCKEEQLQTKKKNKKIIQNNSEKWVNGQRRPQWRQRPVEMGNSWKGAQPLLVQATNSNRNGVKWQKMYWIKLNKTKKSNK